MTEDPDNFPPSEIDAAANIVSAHQHRGGDDGIGPQAPIPSNLPLSRALEDKLNDRADAWETALKGSTGWEETQDEVKFVYEGAGADPLMIGGQTERRHFVKRALYRAMGENNWEWRRWYYGKESIYWKQNLNAPLARRISRAMAAKGISFFFGTKPYFVCYPVGPSDSEFSEAVQKVAEGKMDSSKSTAALRDAITSSFDLGESVLKVAHERRTSLYRKRDTVLGTGPNEPVMDAQGDYITQKDLWFIAEMGQKTLKRDGVTVWPANAHWITGNFARVCAHYSGPRITEIYYRNLLAPLDAPTLQEAECVLHMYEVNPSELAGMFTDSGTGTPLMQTLELLRALAGMDPVAAPDPIQGELPATTKVKCQEFWMRCDADGDGITEDICYVRVNLGGGWRPLFYDYVQNVTSTKERPFHVVRPVARKGSWTGIGAMEMFEMHQHIVDLMLNRWSFAVSSSGFITVFNPAAFFETSGENPDLTLNDGKQYRLRPGMDPEKNLKRFFLDNNIGKEWKDIMQFFLQMAMNESGVMHANDGAAIGMNTTKLATGIRDVQRSGNEIFGVYVAELEDGITDAIRAFVQTLYSRISRTEAVRVLEKDVPQLYVVEPRDVASFDWDVQVILSRYRSEQLMEGVRAVLPDCMAYYTLQPAVQARLAPLFHQLLKAAQIQSPEKIIAPLTDFPPEAIAASAQYAMSLPPEVQQPLAPLIALAAQMIAATGESDSAGSVKPTPTPLPAVQPQQDAA